MSAVALKIRHSGTSGATESLTVTDVGVGQIAVLPSLSVSTIYSGKVVPALEQLKAEFNKGVPDALSENLIVESKHEVSLLRFRSENEGDLNPNVSNFKIAVALHLEVSGGDEHEMMVIQ